MRPLIISSVRDNIKRPGTWSFYEIVHAGMQEDGLAFVDREFHQWNGVDASGMPAYLLGADYVRMFNDDKVDNSFEMYVTIDRPAMLYVFFDDRLTPPKWLRDNFEDTGDNIGMDVGPFTEGELESYGREVWHRSRAGRERRECVVDLATTRASTDDIAVGSY